MLECLRRRQEDCPRHSRWTAAMYCQNASCKQFGDSSRTLDTSHVLSLLSQGRKRSSTLTQRCSIDTGTTVKDMIHATAPKFVSAENSVAHTGCRYECDSVSVQLNLIILQYSASVFRAGFVLIVLQCIFLAETSLQYQIGITWSAGCNATQATHL